MRRIRPDGGPQDLNEGDPDLDVLRCSYGLFGIVTEVTFRVYRLQHQYISLEHKKLEPENGRRFTAAELKKHFKSLLGTDPAGRDRTAGFLYLFPYRNRIVAEVRRKPATEGKPREDSMRLDIRNHFWDKGALDWQEFADSAPQDAHRHRLQKLFDDALQEYLAGMLRLSRVNPVAQIVDFDKNDTKHRFTFSMWAFPERAFAEILPQYFELCEEHEHTFRSCLPHASYHIAQDASSLLSYSRQGAVWTLDPICPENRTAREREDWKRFLDAFNDFCVRKGGVPLLNQTPYLTPEHVRQAFGERLAAFEAARRRFDPGGRMLNDYFAGLLAR